MFRFCATGYIKSGEIKIWIALPFPLTRSVKRKTIFSERELAFTIAIIMLSAVRLLSVVCLSVCDVNAPYSGG